MTGEKPDSTDPEAKLYPLRDIEAHDGPEPVSGGWQRGLPIAIDLGAYQTRVGYASDSLDNGPAHSFYSQMSKYRDRRANRLYTLVGNDVLLDQSARQQAKFAYDGRLLSNWEVVETILDYSFSRLAVGSSGSVENPIVVSETLAAPLPQRKLFNELLFEGYNVPAAAYGIDSLFAFHYNEQPQSNGTGLVISCGHESTHVVPVVEGRGILSQSKRINWGGRQSATYLQSLLSLKYPGFPSKLSLSQASCLMHDYCYVSPSYVEEGLTVLNYDTLAKQERIIQAPFSEAVVQEKSEADKERLAEQRRESGRRLQEQAAKKRLEKLVEREQQVQYYNDLKDRIAEIPNKREVKRVLERDGLKDEAALNRAIYELGRAIKRSKKQDIGGPGDETPVEEPTFPLVGIPDEDLDEEGIKEKRKQRLLKASYDARIKAKEEKLAEEQRAAEAARKDAEWRQTDLAGWVKDRREKLDALVTSQREKKRLREELSDRKSLASQMRMKSIAALASDSTKGRRRPPGGNVDYDQDDTFGANDDDWAVYRRIANASDSEEDEEEQKRIKSLQDELLEHDPDFTVEDTKDAQLDWRKSTIHMFLRGPHEFDPESKSQANQLNLNIERIRVPEVMFQPSIAGVDQAGIVELAGDMLLRNRAHPLASNVLLYGGHSRYPNFDTRLQSELRSLLPVDTRLSVRRAKDPANDAWRGMARWSLSDLYGKAAVTRAEYLEMGSEYMKEHGLGNSLVA